MECLNAWKCEKCRYKAPEPDFGTAGDHVCPKCKSEDVFPLRMFRCLDCGFVAPQIDWFPEWPLDENPLEEKISAEKCKKCYDTREIEDGHGSLTYPRLELVPTEIL
jgi:Zn finger protein HypA/HybF involved in hydrogenase expression